MVSPDPPRTAESERLAVSGAAGLRPGEDVPAVPGIQHEGDGTMNTAMALPGNSDSTFLTHLLARGLEDDRYVVERFQAMVDGDIRRWPGDKKTPKGRRKSTAMATRYGERLLAARGGAAQLARLQGRDRAVARRRPPAPAVPDRPAQHRARPAAAPSERGRQEPQRPDGIQPRRTGPDDRRDVPAGALARTVEEIVRRRLLRSARPRAGDAVRPWPAGGSGPSRPDACAPTASRAGPGIAAAPRDRVSAPCAACPGRAIENCRIRIDDRSAFAARAPP